MKKLLFLLLLPFQAAAVQYHCEPWKPVEICDYDGYLQDSFVWSLWNENPRRFIANIFPFTQEYTSSSVNGYVNWKEFVAVDIDRNKTPAGNCSQICTEVQECDFGEITGPDGICTAVTWGPYLCGNWVSGGDIEVDPLSGQPTAAWDQSMAAEGWLYNFTLDGGDQREELFVNRYMSHYYVLDGDGLIDLRPQMVFNANQHCPRIPDGLCPDGWDTNEIGICVDPTNPPTGAVTREILPDLTYHANIPAAAYAVGAQMRAECTQGLHCGSFIYRSPGLNMYRYSTIMERSEGHLPVESLQAIADFVLGAGHELIGYIHIHAGDTPTAEDHALGVAIRKTHSISLFYLYNQYGRLEYYWPR